MKIELHVVISEGEHQLLHAQSMVERSGAKVDQSQLSEMYADSMSYVVHYLTHGKTPDGGDAAEIRMVDDHEQVRRDVSNGIRVENDKAYRAFGITEPKNTDA